MTNKTVKAGLDAKALERLRAILDRTVATHAIAANRDAARIAELEDGLRDLLEMTDDPDHHADPEESVFAHARALLNKEPSSVSALPHAGVSEEMVEAVPVAAARPCTCHPDDNPPNPCAQRYALSECQQADAGEPGIKELQWTQKAPPGREHEPFVYWAAGLGGHYSAEPDGLLWMADDEFTWQQHPTQAAAKAAAQADYEARIRSALIPTTSPAHPDDLAVDRFATTMKAKLARKREEGRGGWDGPTCSAEILSQMLRKHVDKGDPVDVANLAMMLHQRGEGIV